MRSVCIFLISVFIPLATVLAQQTGVKGNGTASTVFAISKDQPVDAGLTRSLAIEIRIQDTGVLSVYVNSLNETATVKRIGLKEGAGERDLWLMHADRNPPENDIVCWTYDKSVKALKLTFHANTLISQPTVTLEVLDKKASGSSDALSMVLENNAKNRLTVNKENP